MHREGRGTAHAAARGGERAAFEGVRVARGPEEPPALGEPRAAPAALTEPL